MRKRLETAHFYRQLSSHVRERHCLCKCLLRLNNWFNREKLEEMHKMLREINVIRFNSFGCAANRAIRIFLMIYHDQTLNVKRWLPKLR